MRACSSIGNLTNIEVPEYLSLENLIDSDNTYECRWTVCHSFRDPFVLEMSFTSN